MLSGPNEPLEVIETGKICSEPVAARHLLVKTCKSGQVCLDK